MAGRTPGGCRATQRDSRDRVAGIAINARPRPAREGTPPLSASQLFTALAGRQRRYGLRRRPTWRIPSARKMGERPARKWQGSGAVVHGPPTADGGQPHPHFHARAAAPARGNARRLHASAWRGAGRRARFAAREKWGSDRPARGRGAVRLSTGRQRRTVGNRIPISTPELPRLHAANPRA